MFEFTSENDYKLKVCHDSPKRRYFNVLTGQILIMDNKRDRIGFLRRKNTFNARVSMASFFFLLTIWEPLPHQFLLLLRTLLSLEDVHRVWDRFARSEISDFKSEYRAMQNWLQDRIYEIAPLSENDQKFQVFPCELLIEGISVF